MDAHDIATALALLFLSSQDTKSVHYVNEEDALLTLPEGKIIKITVEYASVTETES